MDERPIREAAAAICVREGPSGAPEMLAVRRSDESRFLPGYISFPGGALEPEDEDRARRWFGDATERHRAAALREAIEEVGIAITGSGVVASSATDALDRDPPAAAAMHEICRWVAPPVVPVRFDARYFAIAVEGDVEPVVDDREIADAWWTTAGELLAAWDAGEHKLYWPTWFTVGQLATCATQADVFALRFQTREPTEDEQKTMPRHVMEQIP